MDFNMTKSYLKEQAKLIPLAKTQKELHLKTHDAAEYRKKILSQQHKEGGKSSKMIFSDENKTTFYQCVFNMSNILMGVGMLCLPFAFASSGFLGGVFAIVTFATICRMTSILIGRELNGDPRPLSYFAGSPSDTTSSLSSGSDPAIRMRKSISSFPEIAREAFGDTGAILLGIVLYFELFSCLAIFIVSIGDHMRELFPSVSVQTHMIGFTIVSTLPVIGKT
jgi:vesicular inhibitory amino acid transporter